MRPRRGQLGGPSPSGTPTHHIRSRFHASMPFLRPVAPPATASRASFCFFDEHGCSRVNPTAAVGFPRRGRAAKTTKLERGRQGTQRQTTNCMSYHHTASLNCGNPFPSAEAGYFAAHACCKPKLAPSLLTHHSTTNRGSLSPTCNAHIPNALPRTPYAVGMPTDSCFG